MSQADAQLLRGAWEAFARGDVDAAVAAFDPQVRWHAAGDPDGDGACHNRDDATAFIRRALTDGLTAELLDIHDAGDHLVAVIHTHVPPDWQPAPEPHGELVTVDGKVTKMVVYPTVEKALAAAGLDERPQN